MTIPLDELRANMEHINSAEVVAEHAGWLQGRPAAIQETARKYPFNQPYRVRTGAPYGGSYPGSIGGLVSYFEDGSVTFQVLINTPDQWVPDDIRYQMDPQWLEQITWDEVVAAHARALPQADPND